MTLTAPGDIDSRGHWHGAEMGCLQCGAVRELQAVGAVTVLSVDLVCGECGEKFGEYEI